MRKIIIFIFLIFSFNISFGYDKIDVSSVRNILSEHFDDYLENKNIYEKSFLALQNIDSEASINPYYFLKLSKKVNSKELYKKSFVYIFYEMRKKLSDNKTYFSNYKQKIIDEIKLNETFVIEDIFLDDSTIKFLEKHNFNYLSKNDLNKMKNYIIKNKVGIDSKYFQNYLKFSNFLNNIQNKIFLSNNFTQKLQEENLSCELNSASLFASYLLNKEIFEKDIKNHLDIYDKKIVKNGKKYYWGNPDIEFVGDFNGKQTKFIDKITGYGVNAGPINNSLNKLGLNSKIDNFNKENIINGLIKDSPVVFWYLSKNKSGELNTKPIKWYSNSGKEVLGYIGEHTGVIVGVSLYNNGDINEVYFYEGKNSEIQIIPYKELYYQSSFFNKIISE